MLRFPILFCLLSVVLFTVGCGDKSNEIDRPDDQGYQDPGNNERDKVAVDAEITSFTVEGQWSHAATTTGNGVITNLPDGQSFEARLAVDDNNGWEAGSVDVTWSGTGTDVNGNQENETVFIKEIR